MKCSICDSRNFRFDKCASCKNLCCNICLPNCCKESINKLDLTRFDEYYLRIKKDKLTNVVNTLRSLDKDDLKELIKINEKDKISKVEQDEKDKINEKDKISKVEQDEKDKINEKDKSGLSNDKISKVEQDEKDKSGLSNDKNNKQPDVFTRLSQKKISRESVDISKRKKLKVSSLSLRRKGKYVSKIGSRI